MGGGKEISPSRHFTPPWAALAVTLIALTGVRVMLPRSELALVDYPLEYGWPDHLNEYTESYHQFKPSSGSWPDRHTMLQKERLRVLRRLLAIVADARNSAPPLCNASEMWVAGGTLLGALRYSDLLPWDQDADVDVFLSASGASSSSSSPARREELRGAAEVALRAAVDRANAAATAATSAPVGAVYLLTAFQLSSDGCLFFKLVHEATGFYTDVQLFARHDSSGSGGQPMLECLGVNNATRTGTPRRKRGVWIEQVLEAYLPLHTHARIGELAVRTPADPLRAFGPKGTFVQSDIEQPHLRYLFLMGFKPHFCVVPLLVRLFALLSVHRRFALASLCAHGYALLFFRMEGLVPLFILLVLGAEATCGWRWCCVRWRRGRRALLVLTLLGSALGVVADWRWLRKQARERMGLLLL